MDRRALQPSARAQTLKAHLAQCAQSLLAETSVNPPEDTPAALVYVGNIQDGIPRAIWTDPLLEAIDVRVWGYLRIHTDGSGGTALPGYDRMRQDLNIARSTVSRSLFILRATRWLSISKLSVRDGKGKFRKNINLYCVHDAPLALNDTVELDIQYMNFLMKLESHRHSRVRRISRAVLFAFNDQLGEQGGVVRGGFDRLIVNQQQRHRDYLRHVDRPCGSTGVQNLNSGREPKVQYSNSGLTSAFGKLNCGKNPAVQKTNFGQETAVQNLNPSQKLEEIRKDNQQEANIDEYLETTRPSRSSSYLNKKTTTVNQSAAARASEFRSEPSLDYPTFFNGHESGLADHFLQSVDPQLKQAFLDELCAQVDDKKATAKPIRKPIGYLTWLCTEHANGRTHLTALGEAWAKQRRDRYKHETLIAYQSSSTYAQRELEKLAEQQSRGRRRDAI